MKIKICGLKYIENIAALASLNIDMMGFIFYEKSPRFVGKHFDASILKTIPKTKQTVGVFVDEKLENIITKQQYFGFSYIQLHGNEKVDYCKQLKENSIKIIKAFSIDKHFNFSRLIPYQPYCDYFLFDTKGKEKGGNGCTFNWQILEHYQLDTPFLLSGGIGIENIDDAINLKHPQLLGVDINSKIESSPGLKLIEAAKFIINKIKFTTQ